MHNPPDTLAIVGIFYKVFRKKYVFDHHDISPELYLTRVSGKKDIAYSVLVSMEKLSCKCSDIVISTNESYKRIVMNRHHIGAEKIYIVRNNPKIEDCNMESSGLKKDEADKKEILFLGAINPQDGVQELLKVMVHLVYVLRETNVVCNIVGGGDYLATVKKLAEEMRLNEYVHFAGVIHDRSVVKKYLYQSLIGVEPAPLNAANEHSTFIKVMEYMASRTPVVAFDLKETRFSADGGAILIEPGDIPAFANAIAKLLRDKELRTQMGNRGFHRVQEELNWQKSIDSLSVAYQSLLQ
jgi:glycosyltransferase involved in cell wall biosynthesis